MIVGMTGRRDEIGRLARKAASGDLEAAKRLVAELEAKTRRDPVERPEGTPGKWEVQILYSGMVNYVVEADDPEDAAARARANYRAGFTPTNLGNEWEKFESFGEIHRLYDDHHQGEHFCERCEGVVSDDLWDSELELCAGCAGSPDYDEHGNG